MIRRELDGYASTYSDVIRPRILAWIFRIGNAVFSRHPITGTKRVDLPLQDDSAVGRAQKRHLLITYLPAENNRS